MTLTATLLAAAMVAPAMPADHPPSIAELAASTPALSTLTSLLESTGLDEALAAHDTFTVYAPTNDAFAALPEATLSSLADPHNVAALKAVLLYHVSEGRIDAAEIAADSSIKTLNGARVSGSVRDGRVFINDSGILQNDIDASNGVVHLIDAVLIPRDVRRFASTWRQSVHEDGVEADVIEVTVNAAGSATMTNLKAREVIVNLSGGGSAYLSGEAETVTIRQSGGTGLNALELAGGNVTIQISGGSSAKVRATESLSMRVSGSARVYYDAPEEIVDKHVSRYSRTFAVRSDLSREELIDTLRELRSGARQH